MEENPGQKYTIQVETTILNDVIILSDVSKYALRDSIGDGKSRGSNREDERKIKEIRLSGDVHLQRGLRQ